MHRALLVPEILLNIFCHCYNDNDCEDYDEEKKFFYRAMASLARTCHVFREPALDVLWEELDELSPLARCLPEASRQLSQTEYSFSRQPTQTEWEILRSYTCRIRFLQDEGRGLDQESLKILSNPPTTELLFLNVRRLHCEYKTESVHLFHLPFPSLTTLRVELKKPHQFQNSLDSFPALSPNLRSLFIEACDSDVAFNKSVCNSICLWKNLQVVYCHMVALDVDALVHLSHLPAFGLLYTFVKSTTLPAFDVPLFFSTLGHLILRSRSLGLISSLLSQCRLPALMKIYAHISHCPPRRRLASFLACVQASNASHTIQLLKLEQSTSLPSNVVRSDSYLLGLEDLRPCMAFNNLHYIYIDIEWNVSLTDSELLAMVSAWPQLKVLHINERFGWNTQGGITPNGLVQLLQTCRSLHGLALAMDTRGFTEFSSSGMPAGLPFSRKLHLTVLDSTIDTASVPAVIAFFACIFRHQRFTTFLSWRGERMARPPGWEVYRDRWDDVARQVTDLRWHS